jgi:hypothetical protein
LIGSYAYLTDTRATAHSWLTVPIIKFITHDDPEEAHHLAIKILKLLSKIQLIRDVPQPHDELLSFEVCLVLSSTSAKKLTFSGFLNSVMG